MLSLQWHKTGAWPLPEHSKASRRVSTRCGAQAIVPGLATRATRQMTLQHGDEAIDGKPATSAAAGGPGARLGRNDPCYCGSGLKYKKCHGK